MIDANIFNSSVRPAEDPAQQYNRLAQLVNTRQQIQQGSVTLKNAQQQQAADIADRAAQAKATVIGPDGKATFDRNIYLGELAKGAASGKVIGQQGTFLKQDQEAAKAQQETTATKLANAKQQVQMVGNAANSVLQAPPEQRAQAYAQTLAALHQQGIDMSQMPQQYDEGLVTRYRDMAINAEKQIDQHLAQVQYNDKQPGIIADSNKAVKIEAGTSPQGITAEQAQQNATTVRGQNMTAATAKRGQDLTNGAFSANIPQGVTGDMALMSMSPSMASTVKAIGDGKIDFATMTSRMPPGTKANLASAVLAYKPDYDQKQFGIEKKVQENFTSGDYSRQLNAINTAREHMGTFKELATALKNNDTQLINRLGNAWAQQTGGSAPTNFAIAKAAFSGEVGKSFAGANVAQADRQELDHQIATASSPEQLMGAAETADKLLEGKQHALKQTYDAGMRGKPNFGSSGISVTDPQGGVHTFKTQADADNFKKMAQIK